MPPRHDLVERRKQLGYTRGSLAAALGVSQDTIRNWERGRWDPTPRRRPALASALNWPLERLSDALKSQAVTATLRTNTGGQDAPAVDHRLWARNVEPEQALSYLTDQWHALVQSDNVIGPRHALHGVQQHIPLLTALIDHGPDATRRRALRMAAHYAESASWLHEDLAEPKTAHHWATQALRLARSSGDDDLVTWTHFRRSQQALSSTQPDPHAAHQALEHLALAHDEGHPTASMRAALDAQHALTLAALGHESSAHRLLDRADHHTQDADAGDARNGHGSFATPEWVTLQRAWCWTLLGRPTKATSLFQAGLPRLPAVYQRDRAAHLVRLAMTHSVAGHIDAAAHHAQQAWNLAQSVSSGRCLSDVRSLVTSLRRHHRVAEVQTLFTAVTDTGD
ncbi:helix-turn-helix transcriptional regulator [Saccharopolyspora endophytica]|uniref:Helix-turn-helix transcriptional regulator n=1 Tax=Saccharopolyspora endophytica TaxID=543886 RepID=A0ABS5DAB0_9PSEU|nr:helix-turn-helix transcriptional regulator [Saccharopolyspora endophytica]MBQ0923107.1 helix-turn-helix transcriptional regulator [Saccharopolyspora endophytica]